MEDPIDVQQPPATRGKQRIEQIGRFGLLDYLSSLRLFANLHLQNGGDTGAVPRFEHQLVLLGQPDSLRRF